MDPLQPGDPAQVGAYRLEGRLGGGGMGRVFLGRSPSGRMVAVKVVHPWLAGDREFRIRFAREVEAARRVGGFYTAQVVDAGADADPPWLVTAYVPGPSLQEAVRARGPLPADRLRGLGAGLAEGLAAVHACGLVHRDLKPGNVIMADDGPRLIDFGISRALDASALTAAQAVIGTPAYMSPEQAGGQPVTAASDVFSLGSVLLYAATGAGPFRADTPAAILYQVVHAEPDLAGMAHLPAELISLVTRCLAKDPAARPSVTDILTWLTDPAQVRTPPQQAAKTQAPRPSRADCYARGQLAKQEGDLDAARHWFTQAAADGHAAAMYELGSLERSQGDLDAACHWYAQSAANGQQGALYALGYAEQERGDLDAACLWFAQAAADGYASAAHALKQAEKLRDDAVVGVYTRAGESNDPAAAYAAGLLERERGNIEEARRWLTRAAAGGYPAARGALQSLPGLQ